MASNTLIPKAGKIEVSDPPTIQPIEFIKQIIDNVNAQLASIDKELTSASQGDASLVRSLFDSVHEMKSRADQADMILLTILSDQKNMEYVGSRLNNKSETFKSIDELVKLVQELEKELKEGEFDYYRVVAELLVEIQEQMIEFKPYSATPHIGLIFEKIEAIRSELKRQVTWSIREMGPLTSAEKYGHECQDQECNWEVDVSSLSQIYMVVDALGDKFRRDLLERFAQLQLIPYEKLFCFGMKYSGLDSLDQRYAWFKYLLRLVEDKLFEVIPSKWEVAYHLFAEFSRRTKNHLSEVLAVTYKELSNDLNTRMTVIVKALKSVINFENEMIALFKSKDSLDGGENTYELQDSMRDAFDLFLGDYVQIERKGLEDLMQNVMNGEDSINTNKADGSTPVYVPGEPYDSSHKIFEYIKGSLKRCSNFSTGMTFLSLSKEFRVCLQQYVDGLKARCPEPFAQPKGKPPIFVIKKKTEITLCRIICTGEYCIDTIPALETMMKQKIKDQYQNQVDFQPQVDSFMDMLSYAMMVLASGEIQRMEPHFLDMKKVNWATLDSVGDVGYYVKDMLQKVLNDCVPRIRNTMSPVYFQNVCSKLAISFLDSYLDYIWQIKRVSKAGGGQLLLDLNGIKEYLLTMPNVRLPEGKDPINIGKPYLIVVTNKVKKIENIFKLICAEDNMLDEMFGVLWPEATKEEMDNILIMKGLKSPLDQVGDILKDGAKKIDSVGQKTVGKISKASQGAVGDITNKFQQVGGNLKNAFGDIMSGNIFHEGSTHSAEGSASNHGSSVNTKSKLSSAVGGISAAMNFKKPISDATSTTSSTSRK